MLEDRPYMRRPRFDSYRSATFWLIAINVVAFLVQIALSFTKVPLYQYGALSLYGLKHGYLWQLLTFQFMHAGWLHLIGNCLVIFLLGPEVEGALGRKSYYTLYLCSGMIGGAAQILAGYLFPARFGGGVVGASAGGFGIVAAFAMLYPDRPLSVFLLPIMIRAKYLLLIFAGGAIIEMLFFPSQVADAAHLGGMLAGIGFIRYAIHLHWPGFRRTTREPTRRLVKVHSQKAGSWGQPKPDIEDLPPEEFVSREVDPILEKITAHGIQSLTDRERKVLEAAGKKMPRRP